MFIWNMNLIPWHKSFLLDFYCFLPLFHTYRGWWPQALVLPEECAASEAAQGFGSLYSTDVFFLMFWRVYAELTIKQCYNCCGLFLEAFSDHSVTETGHRYIKQHSEGSTCQGRCCSSHWHQLTSKTLTVHQGLQWAPSDLSLFPANSDNIFLKLCPLHAVNFSQVVCKIYHIIPSKHLCDYFIGIY